MAGFDRQQIIAAFIFTSMIYGCSEKSTTEPVPTPAGQTSNEALPAEETPSSMPTEAGPQDNSESVLALEKAGCILKRNEQGVVVTANCKTASMTNELMEHLRGIPNVETLDLENGQFDNDGLTVLDSLNKLKVINLRQCSRLDENGFAHLTKAPTLERVLLLYSRANDETLKHVAKLDKLKVLDLRGTEVGDEGVAELTALKNLVDLKIRSSSVSDESMDEVSQLSKLRYLSLEDASLLDAGLEELSALKNLVSLNIMRAYVTDEGLKEFGEQKLRDFRARDTGISGSGLAYLEGSRDSLEVLDLSEVRIDNAGVAEIAPFKNLKALYIWNGSMDDEGLKVLEPLQKLEILDIHGSQQLSSACVDTILKLKNLKELDLSETGLSDDGLAKLAKHESLQKLAVSNTAVSRDGIAKFQTERPKVDLKE